MGCGHFSQVIYGLPSLSAAQPDHIDRKTWAALIDQFVAARDVRVAISSELPGDYFGLTLMHNLCGNGTLFIGVCTLDKLVERVQDLIPTNVLERAQTDWQKIRRIALSFGVDLPEPQIVWADDYD